MYRESSRARTLISTIIRDQRPFEIVTEFSQSCLSPNKPDTDIAYISLGDQVSKDQGTVSLRQ